MLPRRGHSVGPGHSFGGTRLGAPPHPRPPNKMRPAGQLALAAACVFACGLGRTAAQVAMRPCDSERSALPCEDLLRNATAEDFGFWPDDLFGHDFQPGVCGISGLSLPGTNQQCPATASTFHEALQTCAQMGARLCTLAEIQRDEARGTGCGYDTRLVWTSTRGRCPEGMFMRATGSSLGDTVPKCGDTAMPEASVRCCADYSPAGSALGVCSGGNCSSDCGSVLSCTELRNDFDAVPGAWSTNHEDFSSERPGFCPVTLNNDQCAIAAASAAWSPPALHCWMRGARLCSQSEVRRRLIPIQCF